MTQKAKPALLRGPAADQLSSGQDDSISSTQSATKIQGLERTIGAYVVDHNLIVVETRFGPAVRP